MEMDANEEENTKNSNREIFSIKSVNSYGTTDLDTLYDDDNKLNLTSERYPIYF